MITIDSTRCTACGFCSDECPAGVLLLNPALGAKGAAEARYPEECTLCGHCVAVCPHDAVDHTGLPATGFDLAPAFGISSDQMRDLLLSRRSIRAFRKDQIPREQIEQLLEVATHAGTASNAQQEGFVVVQDGARLSELENMVIEALWRKLKPLGSAIGRKLARMKYGEEMVNQSFGYYERFKKRRDAGQLGGAVFRNAPAVIMVHGQRSNPLAPQNCSIATRNMEILATSMKLGTCWAGFLLIAAGFSDAIARYLQIADTRNIYGAIMVGHPKHDYKKVIPRGKRAIRWM